MAEDVKEAWEAKDTFCVVPCIKVEAPEQKDELSGCENPLLLYGQEGHCEE